MSTVQIEKREYRDNFEIIPVSNPRLFFSNEDPIGEATRIIQNLESLTHLSFGSELDEKSSDGLRDHVKNVDRVALLAQENNLLGFASVKLFPEFELMYLHGVAISNSFKGRGGALALIQYLLKVTELPFIAFTTQNPVMFCLLQNMSQEVYPSLEKRQVPENLQGVGKILVNGRGGKFDPKTFVIENLYHSCLYDRIPLSRDQTVNAWFEDALDIKGGKTRSGLLLWGKVK